MRFEVLSRDDMNALSRELSRAGIMNRTREEVSSEISHYVVVRGTYAELVEKAGGIEILQEALDEVKFAFDEMAENWETGKELSLEDLLEDADTGKIALITALIESNAVKEKEGKIILGEKPTIDNLIVELRFPIEEAAEYLNELEGKFDVRTVTEYTLEKRYLVEVMEVERELIERALEIAEEYATEESLVRSMFEGIARSVLAEVVLELAEKHRRKNELIEALLELEPVVVEGEKERLNIYFDENVIEDFLKELQTLGYLKVKGNRIWI